MFFSSPYCYSIAFQR